MIKLGELKKYLDDFLLFDKILDVSKIDPYMTNGLMIEGREEVRKIGFGVSASLSLFEKAQEENCDTLIVHHSFNLPDYNHYDSIFQHRIAFLIKNNISLFGYHFLLDAHPEIGNNVEILKTIKAKPTHPYFHQGQPWGWIGEYENDMSLNEIVEILKPHLSKRTVVYEFGRKDIKRVVAISGMGSPRDMQELLEKDIDLYITGEVHEWNRELFREAGINFIAGGHYATEVFGVKALMEKVKEQFPIVEVEFLDLPNEI